MLVFENGYVFWDEVPASPQYDERGDIERDSKHEVSARCFIETTSERNIKYEDGFASNASYVISIDRRAIPSVALSDSGRLESKYIRLQHDRKGDLGVFTVQRIEYHELTKSISVWV